MASLVGKIISNHRWIQPLALMIQSKVFSGRYGTSVSDGLFTIDCIGKALPKSPFLSMLFNRRSITCIADRVLRKKMRTSSELARKKALKQRHWVTSTLCARTEKEQKLLERIARAQKNIEVMEEKLKLYQLPPPIRAGKPEFLTAEEMNYLKRLGSKGKNYVPVGRRGVFGGVIQNMHLHWKKHQTVKIRIKGFSEEEVVEMAKELEVLSGGTVVSILNGNVAVMYRGKCYSQPEDYIPKNTLTKRKALLKSKAEQALRQCRINKENAEKELELYREYIASEMAKIPLQTSDGPTLLSSNEVVSATVETLEQGESSYIEKLFSPPDRTAF